MSCQRCESSRILRISAKCDDRCIININNKEKRGYVPEDIGVDGGDYVRISYCLECGQLQGKFPLEQTEIEINDEEADEDADEDEKDE